MPMRVGWILVLVLAAWQAAWAKTEVLTLKWGELSAAVANREATLLIGGNVRLTGTVTKVLPDAVIMTIRKTSDKKGYPAGEASIPRKAISQIRLKRIEGRARLIGAAGIGGGAALGTLPWAISESRTNVSDNKRIGQWVAIAIGATAGGYLIGRLIDTKETVITLAPEP